jgi:hypothetical protein
MDGLARKKLRDRGRKQSNNTQNQMKESSGYFSSLYKTDDLYYTILAITMHNESHCSAE